MPNEYNVGSGLSEQELQFASFWTRNRMTIKKTGYGTLIAVIVVLWGYVSWSLLDAYAISYPREQRIAQNIASNEHAIAAIEAARPQPIQPSGVEVFNGTDGRQDFLVQITNPNPQWWAEFDYRFDTNGEQTPLIKGYVLPKQQRYLTQLGWKGKNRAASAQLLVENLRWRRLDPAAVNRDYDAFFAQRMQLSFDDIAYRKDIVIGSQTVGQSAFTMRNASGYGFWDAELTIVLFRAETPIAVTTFNAREVKPNETRSVAVNWFENLSAISKTEIQANVNLLDPRVYLPSERF